MADIVREINPPVVKIVEIPRSKDQGSPSLSEIMKFLGEQKFDPNKVRYEVPFSKKITPEDLRVASKWLGYEVLVMGFVRDGKPVYRLMTGKEQSVSHDTLIPELKGFNLEPEDIFRKAYGDIVLDDDGKLTGKPLLFRFHNHRNIPYPSYPDIRSKLNTRNDCIGVNGELVVIGEPQKYPNISNRDLFDFGKGKKTVEILYDAGMVNQAFAAIEMRVRIDGRISDSRYDLDEKVKLSVDIETARRVCDFFGVKIKRYKFGVDDDKIQAYLDSIQNI